MTKKELYNALIAKFDKEGADLIIELVKVISKTPRTKKEYTDAYEFVWQRHPKGGKDAGYNAYKKIDHNVWTDDTIAQSLIDHQKSEWKGRPSDKIPHLSTFLNGGYYKTEIKVKSKAVRSRCHSCGGIQTDDRKNDMFCFDCDFKERQKQ